ncbi:MAG TPA: hypothetical protein VEX13_10850, partial [Chloroflexia bacterium]|nr:hypothetical protein [Chloroflexia bacterium]
MKLGYSRITAFKLGTVTIPIPASTLLKPLVWHARHGASAKISARLLRLTVILSLLVGITAFAGRDAHISVSSAPTASSILGVFEGTTPCHNIPRPLPQIPANIDCELMTWKITLYQDPNSGVPTTFSLISAFGLTQPGTPGIRGGGTKVEMEGKWAIIRGTKTDLSAVVYQLNPDNPSRSVSFLKLDDYLLHVLGRDKGLMVGNAAWSYTLNRTDAARAQSSPQNMNPASQPALVPLPVSSSTLGVFEGRTGCSDIALRF